MSEELWDALVRQSAEEEARRRQQARQALAALLAVRGQRAAAAIVAVSGWRTDLVDNWNGGQYRAVLEVPPASYDLVTGDLRDALARAAGDVVGDGFTEFTVEVKIDEAQPGWDEQLLTWLREQQGTGNGTPAEPVVHGLPPGPVDAL